MKQQVDADAAQYNARWFLGRSREIAQLARVLGSTPAVVIVHGIGGIGKSSLLQSFAAHARRHGAAVVALDCHTIEPTERGFLHELKNAVGGEFSSAADAAARMGELGSRVVLILDSYELFRLMDTWMRQVLVRKLPRNVSLVIAGRDPPVAGWIAEPGWGEAFDALELGPLDHVDALELLKRKGFDDEKARRVNRQVGGHPLALKLATHELAATGNRPEAVAMQRVVEELTEIYLSDVPDALTRQALEAASVVRRTTLSLLRAMVPAVAPQDAFERLRVLPFVDMTSDGLYIHDAVRNAISAHLRASDPVAYLSYRRAAWHQLRAEVRMAGISSFWRYTADMLYLIENPVTREAFFPSGAYRYAVEPARSGDGNAIREICRAHEPPSAAAMLDRLWSAAPESFSVARDNDSSVAGFYCMLPLARAAAVAGNDPLILGWMQHVAARPLEREGNALFLRRWLSREEGELPSLVQAACWLDIKRSYMELRPHLRRVYLAVRDLPAYAPVAQRLFFETLPEHDVEIDGDRYYSACLDFGAESVDGWLARLAKAELGLESDGLLDADNRAVVIAGVRIALTRLEFATLSYLHRYAGKPITRDALLAEVWGYNYQGESNLVDVVVRSMRKKLGTAAPLIETVRGVGYRFQNPQAIR